MNGALVVGLGNRDRGDDGLGLEVAARLRERALGSVDVLDGDGDLAALLDAWEGRSLAVLVDAAAGGDAPGTVRRFEAHRRPLPASLRQASTHSFGAAEAVGLARVLGRLPPALIVYSVEGAGFELGHGLSAAAAAAIPGVVESVLAELGLRDQQNC